MINYANSLFVKTDEHDYVPGENLNDEGMALVFKQHEGQNLLGLSTGAEGEVFAGFSLSRAVPATHMAHIDEGTVQDGRALLSKTMEPDQFLIKLDGKTVDSANISVGETAPTGDTNQGKVVIDGNKLLFHPDDEGKPYFVQYQYEMSASEASLFHGDGPIGGASSATMGRIGRIISATKLSISNFDASVDWNNVVHPTLGADGIVTVGGDGTVLTNWVVANSPARGNAFLTLKSVQ